MELRPIFTAMMRSKTGVILIALQIALTLAILANALYVVDDRLEQANRPSGLDEANTFHLSLLDRDSALGDGVINTDVSLLRSIPGVEAAAWVNQVPLSQSGNNSGYQLEPDAAESTANAATYMVGSDALKAWPLRLVEGRAFTAEEEVEIDETKPGQPHPRVAVVTRGFARAMWPDTDAVVGKVFYWGSNNPPTEVIGVVETLVSPWGRASWGGDGTRSVLLPVVPRRTYNTFAVRTAPGQRERVMKEAEALLAKQVAGRMAVANETMEETRENRYGGERTLANGLLVVIVLLLVMTASGIVGLASLWVNQRRKQIGVRRALGARRVDILRYFITENLMISSFGVVAGIGLALGLNSLMMKQLEVDRLPLPFLLIGAGTLMMLGVLAVSGPARRAAAIPPATATRSV